MEIAALANTDQYDFLNFKSLTSCVLTIGPRIIIVGVVAYCALGWAIAVGLMARIDLIAIPIIRSYVGLFGLGVIMPTFQWYAAWAVRISAAILAEGLFEILLCAIKCVYQRVKRAIWPVKVEVVTQEVLLEEVIVVESVD